MNENLIPDSMTNPKQQDIQNEAIPLESYYALFHAERRVLAIRTLATMLILSYPIIVLPAFLPFQFFDSGWLQGVINSLIGQAPTPLIGIAMLLVAKDNSQETAPIRKLLSLVSSLTLVVMIGFYLLVPLQVSTLVRDLLTYDKTLGNQIREVKGRGKYDTITINNASNKKELQGLIPLELAKLRNQVAPLALPEAKKLLIKGMQANNNVLVSRIAQQRNENYVNTAKTAVRNILLAIIFGLCFGRCRYAYIFPEIQEDSETGSYFQDEV